MTEASMLARSVNLLGGTLLDVGPLIATLFGFQLLVLKRPIPHAWKVMRGLVYVIVGLVLFLLGLEEAVFPLGDIMARQLTDPAFLFGTPAHMPAVVHWRDYGWVYAFGFCIGLSTTLAEPALIAVGMKAEAVSGGAISAWGLRVSVAVGVAIGVAIGCFRIVTGTDLWVYIIAAYVVVILQSLVAPRIIVPLAYDSGGVTTSTVTVPLLAALGLGLATTIPGRSPLIDGFGLIAFASVFPIMSVMAYAQLSQWWARRQPSKEEHDAL
ncbi:MAG TPA: DUF1538 domain-containing protein [Mariprofundaceae bacterium]|nr:DUF1538 domain-containing protein [Mariprofundaceae bacterium]